uniref:Uncharacterized protein n=1 Tax=Spongospora subterranea TaxID=70186 RepID=A0A0H5QWR5_9EUKA|eukprot:CRZ06187.1 hypothetical protein [Spongospora subterranea]
MGKKSRTKDRMHMTASEWARDFGGHKAAASRGAIARCLPFDHCAVSLTPFTDPVCTKQGDVFDILNIVQYIKKHGKNPIDGSPLAIKDLIRLKFHKNSAGEYHCPLKFKQFTPNSHIVAIATSGNVFSYEAVQQLNLQMKVWTDLVTGEPFTRSDLITIQDPNTAPKMISHSVPTLDQAKPPVDDEVFTGKRLPKRKPIADEPKPQSKLADAERPVKKVAPTYHFTTGACSSSFTSSAVSLVTQSELAPINDADIRARKYEKLSGTDKKAFVRLTTSRGQLNLQLECALAPFACHNFILLCQRGYYNGVAFHRLIKNFMVQGGDPTGTGRGGESAWKVPFRDELKNGLKHDDRGVLSMANSGPDSNNSQFFITMRATPHLNGKHTVFGSLVGGDETLDAIEAIAVDRNDRPVVEVKILSTEVFMDPFGELMDSPDDEASTEKKLPEPKDETSYLAYSDRMVSAKSTTGQAIGKYINTSSRSDPTPIASQSVKKPAGYGDFSNF